MGSAFEKWCRVTGNSLIARQNTNTVDVIFPSWPLFLYTNPVIGKQLLLPLFEYQASGQYPNPWAVHDMGGSPAVHRGLSGLELILFRCTLSSGHWAYDGKMIFCMEVCD